MTTIHPPLRVAVRLVVCLVCLAVSRAVPGADPTFVGKLAFAVDEAGVKRLGLDDEVKLKLIELIDRREREALNMALELKDLPQPEVTARLAPFVAESERQGLALLTLEQRTLLEQVHVARQGLSSLADAAIGRILELTEEQQAQIRDLLEQRSAKLVQGGENDRRVVMQETERKLSAVLSDTQRENWQRLAGMVDGELQPVAPAPTVATPATPTPAPQPSEPPKPPAVAMPKEPTTDDKPAPTAELDVPIRSGEVKLKFNFVHQPWADVLEWFAEQADLSLQLDAPPAGTFNYRDSRSYTPAEAIDQMNRVLLLKGYTLVRSERLLTLLNLEDQIPPQLIEFVSVSDLDQRGAFEIVKCLFHLVKMSPADAETEIGKMIGPQGSVIAFPTANQILVTETAGKLRTIREMIERVENPEAGIGQGIVEVKLAHVGPEEVLSIARPLLNIPEGQNSNDKIRIAVDAFSSRLFVSGDRGLIGQLQSLVTAVDRAPVAGEGATLGALEQPQLMTYAITKADPTQALQVLQTLLAGLPDVRLTVDPVTNKLVALARPAEHRTIVATLQQLEGESDQVEVIQLRRMDPQLVILSANKLLGFGGTEVATTGPKIDGDPISMKLWVRGTSAQIAQVKDLVEKLEGPQDSADGMRKHIRVLPLSGATANSALDNMELFWPTMRENKIRIVTPSAVGSTLRERRLANPLPATNPSTPTQPLPIVPVPDDNPSTPPTVPEPATDPATRGNADVTDTGLFPVNHLWQANEPASAAEQTGPRSPVLGDDIVVSITPNGIVIASNDLDALDDFEALLGTFTSQSSLFASEPTVFWLKYVKADVAAETLEQVVNGASATSSSGGSLLGDMTSSMLGGIGGGLLGGMLGGGSSDSVAAGAASIVADVRLNCLIVQAAASDLLLIERLLPIIDRESSPEEVQTNGRPRLIPVLYMPADQMATIVKQIYPDRVAGASGSNQQQQRQPSPADFIQALRGGGGGGGGRGGRGGGQADSEPQKMTIGVDPRSNSLIVAAPEPLFQEVELLVAQLDREGLESNDAMEVLTIRHGNPEVVKKALAAVIGEQMKTSTTSSSSGSSTPTSQPQPSSGQTDAASVQQRIDFFRSLRDGGGGSSGGFGGFGGGDRGGSTGGRGGGPPTGGGRRGGR